MHMLGKGEYFYFVFNPLRYEKTILTKVYTYFRLIGVYKYFRNRGGLGFLRLKSMLGLAMRNEVFVSLPKMSWSFYCRGMISFL